MKYVFFGTPRFAEVVLKGLIDAGMPPAALVANPDRPAGRKKVITPPPTKTLLLAHPHSGAVAILQPERLDKPFQKELQNIAPDLFIVAAYAKIIPRSVLGIPRLGAIGIHPSLLPRYRGAAPIQSALLDGARETGVTLYLMDEKMDHGPIIAQSKVPVETPIAAYPLLESQLAEESTRLLIQTLPDVLGGKIKPRAQDESMATYTKKFTGEDGRINEDDLLRAEGGDQKQAEAILRAINALNPEPGAWTMKSGKRTKLLKAKIEGGALRITLLQEEGQKPRVP